MHMFSWRGSHAPPPAFCSGRRRRPCFGTAVGLICCSENTKLAASSSENTKLAAAGTVPAAPAAGPPAAAAALARLVSAISLRASRLSDRKRASSALQSSAADAAPPPGAPAHASSHSTRPSPKQSHRQIEGGGSGVSDPAGGFRALRCSIASSWIRSPTCLSTAPSGPAHRQQPAGSQQREACSGAAGSGGEGGGTCGGGVG